MASALMLTHAHSQLQWRTNNLALTKLDPQQQLLPQHFPHSWLSLPPPAFYFTVRSFHSFRSTPIKLPCRQPWYNKHWTKLDGPLGTSALNCPHAQPLSHWVLVLNSTHDVSATSSVSVSARIVHRVTAAQHSCPRIMHPPCSDANIA